MLLFKNFDPNGTGTNNGNYFGLPVTPEDSAVVLLSVPWDVTTSYSAGAASAPDAIIGASTQLDLYDQHAPDRWRKGIGTIGVDYSIQERSARFREDAVKVINYLESGGEVTDDILRRKLEKINAASDEVNEYVYKESMHWLRMGKIVGLVGGDHSTPFGLIRAIAEKDGEIGVLHIDAHRDLRECYEGFTNSHASIMYNVATQIEGVSRITQVAVRDFCDSEQEFAESNPKIVSFDDQSLAQAQFTGENWAAICGQIVATLPEKVYVSFDIDGLCAYYCPDTGTPVPGGITFNQAVFLLKTVVDSGRKIVGFDLCEVAPGRGNEWNANVGARILYKLSNLAIRSNE